MLVVAPPFSHSITTTTTSPTTTASTTNNCLTKSATTLSTTTTTTPRNPSLYDSNTMLPSPPATHQSLAPPSPPSLDLEPSPVYSPLSTPSHSPKPPPSPPLAATGDTYSWDDRVRCGKQQELRNKEKLRGRAAAAGVDKAAADHHDRAAAAAATAPMTTAPPNNPTTTSTAASRTHTDADDGALSPDTIALSSTRRLLDLQLARAKRDIVTLAEMRESALKEPLQFVEYIASTGPRGGRAASSKKSSSESLKNNVFADKEIPKPQEVYRCPHIEWSKYQILGAPLDSLHEKQRRRPSPSQPIGYNGPHGVPPSMQTGGLISREYADSLVGDSGIMQGRLRLFDGLSAQRCVGR